jgi:hypothetical protein
MSCHEDVSYLDDVDKGEFYGKLLKDVKKVLASGKYVV